MADIPTWGWYSPTLWPGFSVLDQNNLDSVGNGLSVDPANYYEGVVRDADADGLVLDHDLLDSGIPRLDETFSVGGDSLLPQEFALYENSTVVINGTPYTGLDMAVILFTDGTWSARLLDGSIPVGQHYSDVDSITLGTWNGVEYYAVQTADIDDPFICFAAGTQIATPRGPRRVETLRPGDVVDTMDHGPRRLIWVGEQTRAGRGKAAPVRISARALGNDAAVLVSRQHRLLLRDPALAPRIGGAEGLVPAIHLVGRPGIALAPCSRVTWVHVMCDRHEILRAGGLWAESLLPGPQALRMMTPRHRVEILRLMRHMIRPEPARPLLTGRDMRWLARQRIAAAEP